MLVNKELPDKQQIFATCTSLENIGLALWEHRMHQLQYQEDDRSR